MEKLTIILIFRVLSAEDVHVFRASGIKGEMTRPPACAAKFVKGFDQPPRTVGHALDRHSRLALKRSFYPPGSAMSPVRAAAAHPHSFALLQFRFKRKSTG